MIAHCTLELGIKSFSLLSKTVKHITKGDYHQIVNGRVKVGWWLIAKIISQERNREAFYLDMEREKKMRKWEKPFRFDQHVGWDLVPLMLLHPGVYLRPTRINLFWNNCVPDLNLYSIIMINHDLWKRWSSPVWSLLVRFPNSLGCGLHKRVGEPD